MNGSMVAASVWMRLIWSMAFPTEGARSLALVLAFALLSLFLKSFSREETCFLYSSTAALNSFDSRDGYTLVRSQRGAEMDIRTPYEMK